MCDKTKSNLILGVFLFLGLYFLGSNLGSSYFQATELERSVSVTGFSEKTVKADSVFWPISYVTVNPELKSGALKMQEDTKLIKEYLLSKGVLENEISFMQARVQQESENSFMRKSGLEMNDALSFSSSAGYLDEANLQNNEDTIFDEILKSTENSSALQNNSEVENSSTENSVDTKTDDKNENEEKSENKKRYIISATILVRTDKVDLVRELSHSINELLVKNINISNQYNYSQIEYKFNQLDSIKQEMLKEANQKAFELAKNFALDTRSTLGKVKSARQGEFNIFTENRFEDYIKKIRVENQIEYYLVFYFIKL